MSENILKLRYHNVLPVHGNIINDDCWNIFRSMLEYLHIDALELKNLHIQKKSIAFNQRFIRLQKTLRILFKL